MTVSQLAQWQDHSARKYSCSSQGNVIDAITYTCFLLMTSRHVCSGKHPAALKPGDIKSISTRACVCVQVQSFVRGRSVRKRRDKLKAEGRAQSVPRDEMLPCKVKTVCLNRNPSYFLSSDNSSHHCPELLFSFFPFLAGQCFCCRRHPEQ